MSAPRVDLAPTLLNISRDVTSAFMQLSVLAVLLDTLGRVIQVETMIGDNGGLDKAIEVPLSLLTTALLTLVGIPVHLLFDRD